MTPSPVTLSQLTAAIGYAIHSNPSLIGVWVMAELSDVRVNSGHCYLELIEKDSSGRTVAKLRATIWQSVFMAINRKFYSATGSNITSGLKVLIRGNASHHAVFGLSFNIMDIDPSYTLGDMERLRREILERLSREGVIDHNKRLNMPMAPQYIAVISAEGAAGYGDFMSQLSGNNYGYSFKVKLFDAIMQGEKTSASIREALERIKQEKNLWDCVVIIRGGGATTDLNGFDEYQLARDVALFPLPVVVGIGHERDRTVLDEIAHTRVKTPTAAAAFFISRLSEAEGRAISAAMEVTRYVTQRISGEIRRIANLEAMIPALTERKLSLASSRLEYIKEKIPMIVNARLNRAELNLESQAKILKSLGGAVLIKNLGSLTQIEERLKRNCENIFQRENDKLENLKRLVEILDPSATLRRGYSVTRFKNKALLDPGKLEDGAEIVTQLANGKIISIVKNTEEFDNL